MTQVRNNVVHVATLADGDVQPFAFNGDSMLLIDVLKKLDFDPDNFDQIQLGNAVIGAEDLPTVTVRDDDRIFLVPLIQGGA